MDQAQLQALKTFAMADPTAAALIQTANDIQLAAWFNAEPSTPFVVWRTSVTWDEIMLNGMDWARVDNLSTGKARIWDWMFNNDQKAMNPSKANIRGGIDAVWVGTAADLAVRDAVYLHCKRNASRAEMALATGTGTTAVPGILSYEGQLDYSTASMVRVA